MRRLLLALSLLLFPTFINAAIDPAKQDLARWQHRAANVEIVRDDWGIAHVYGKSDADAVFGMIYAQCEDDFNRVERNYLLSLGRLAEAEGEKEIYRDLRQKLFIDPADLETKYRQSPQWLKALMDAWADGLNYFLYRHPTMKPRVITHFEPWMALSFSEGSIGGDIERIDLKDLAAFYGKERIPAVAEDEYIAMPEPKGSNGISIAPSRSASRHALLLINPHTSFFFRSELEMVSDEGLHAYGAVTWGQFFIYQGFNPYCGWMHTSSGVDNIDEYLESVTQTGGSFTYRNGKEVRPVKAEKIVVPYMTSNGMAERVFTVFRTHHGPVVRESGDKWVTVRLMNDPMHALMQSYGRTKAKDLKSFMKWMDLHTNSSNNTLFADTSGNIAYLHSNFIPRRDNRFDWTKPVDGSDPATEWHGVLKISETPNVINPKSGWAYNSNNWPWSAAGPDSPKRADYPVYVERGYEESARGLHALMLLPETKNMTIESLMTLAYDSYLPAFDSLLPPLFANYDALPGDEPVKRRLADAVEMLRSWDRRWSTRSAATSLAIFWADDLGRRIGDKAKAANVAIDDYSAKQATSDERFQSLFAAIDKLTKDFGSWKTPWGEINRFQRITNEIDPHFNDAAPSIPVGFTSARWGSLASFGAKAYPDTKRWYGTAGNSFVAVVEFGPRIRARAVTAGGESGHADSPHFNDEAERYATGNLRNVYFYREDLKLHTERTYHP